MLTRAQAKERLESVKPNLVDKAIGVFSPKTELQRFRARQMMALSGGYNAGKKSRKQLTNWKTTQGADADSDIVNDIDTLRDRCRDLSRNNSLAAGITNTKVTSIVGSGMRLNSEIDYEYLGLSREQADVWQKNAEREFNLWAKKPCNIEQNMNFFDLQDLVLRSCLESGDVFALRRYKQHGLSPYELKLQIIEADRVCNPDFQPDESKLVQGIEKNDDGAAVKIHVANQHPGAYTSRMKGIQWNAVPVWDDKTNLPNVLQITRRLRPHQTRGVPDLAPVVEAIKQIGDYKDSELTAAVVTSFLTVFIKSEGGSTTMPGDERKDDEGEVSLGAGAVVGLADDEAIETVNPLRPNTAFDGFVMAMTREIGVAIELPYEVLIKHFTASYSAAQAALLEAWRYFKARREWLVNCFCMPVYEMFLYEALARGRMEMPGFFEDPAVRSAYLGSRWIGPSKGHVNEEVSAKAAAKRIEAEISTRKEEAAELNRDYDQIHKQRAHEERQAIKDGTRMDIKPTDGVKPNVKN